MCEDIIKIVVKKRPDDYSAFIEGNPEIWGRGKNEDDAIGDLVRSHQERFCVDVKYENKK